MVMTIDPFIERLGRVRERFVSALEGKIEDTYAALSDLSEEVAAVEAVAETYRRIHGIVGIGPTVGFAATGRAARALENILVRPHEEERALTSQEIASFKEALHALRETAAQELQSFHSGAR
jgi:chemotaxis protein histidine kinase CheA